MKKALQNVHAFESRSGNWIQNATVIWENNMITFIGNNQPIITSELQGVPETSILDGQGKFVTPGLVDGFSQLGLKESGIRWEGDDSYETNNASQPALSVVDGIYPFDTAFQAARESGVTTIHVAPGPENVISGQTAVIQTKGTVVDEMVVHGEFGLAVSFGEIPKRQNRDKFQYPMTRMGVASLLREQLRKAQYQPDKVTPLMQKVVSGDAPLFVRVHRSDDIVTATRILREFSSVRLTLVHATEGDLVTDPLVQANVSVLGGPFFQARNRYELAHINPATSVKLHNAGIRIGLITDHPTSSVRNLALEASLAIREGMAYADALRAVTLTPAQILGLDDRIGSIEVGKQADLVLWDGEPLELTSKVHQTVIGGEVVYSREAQQS